VTQTDHTGRLAAAAFDEILRLAEMAGAHGGNRWDELRRLSDRLRAAGLEPIARQLDAIATVPEIGRPSAALRAVFALGSLQQLRVRVPYLLAG
jgi:hypothetical protein